MKTFINSSISLFCIAFLMAICTPKVYAQSITLAPPITGITYVDNLSVSYSITGDPSAQQVQVVWTHTSGKNFAADTIKTWTLTMKTPSLSQTFTFKPTDLTNSANAFTASPTTTMPEGFYSVYAQYIRPASAGSLLVRTTTRTNVYLDLYTQTPYLVSPATNGASSSSMYVYDSIPEPYLSGSASLIFDNGSYSNTIKLTDNIFKDSLYINTASVSNPTYIQSASSSTIPDGTYSVTLQYQDRYSHPVASKASTNFLIQTSTPTPSMIFPKSDTIINTLSNWKYLLPCNAASGTAQIKINPGGYIQTLSTHGGSTDSVNITGVLPDGTYSITLTYQDFLNNPAQQTVITNMRLDRNTIPPAFSVPVSGSTFNDTMKVVFNIPEKFDSSGVKLIFDSAGTTVNTIALKNLAVGNDSLTLHINNLLTDTQYVASATKSRIYSGLYTLKVMYADSMHNATAKDSISNITIDLTTLAPTINLPVTGSRYNQLIPISYTLPETPYPGSVKLIFDSAGTGVTDTIRMADVSPRSTIYFNTQQFAATTQLLSATKNAIGDGIYNITLVYSDALNNPSAGATISNVTIDTHTASPVITLPAASASIKGSLTVQFTLPEIPYVSTALLIFYNTLTSDTLIINTLSQGVNTVVLDPANLYASTFVYSADNAVLNDGVYNIKLQYVDDLLNPAAFAVDSNITVDNHTQAPVITYPTSNFSASDTLDVQFTIPEAYTANSITLTFFDGYAGNTLVLQNISTGINSLKLPVHNLGGYSYIHSATVNSLPDGVYSMTLSYQDSLGNSAATNSISGIKFDSQTMAPSIISPSSFSSTTSPLVVSFNLPEAPYGGAATLTFDSAGTTVNQIVLNNVFIGSNTFGINIKDIASSLNITSATRNILNDGIYNIHLTYQDVMKNPAASVAVVSITADTYTKTPTLTLPANSAQVSHSMGVKFTIPESYEPGSVTLLFDSAGTTVNTIVLKNIVAGVDSFILDPANLYFSSPYVLSATKNSLADGVYKLTLSYQDTLRNPAATVFANNITVDLHTQTPTLTAPVNNPVERLGAAVPLTFALPETPMSGSIMTTLTNGSSTYVLTMLDGPSGTFTTSINPDTILHSTGVLNISPSVTSLPEGSYTAFVKYQDALGNPAAATSVGTFTIDRVTLTPTLYYPGNNSTSNGTMNLAFNLPEAALNNTVNIQLTGPDTLSMNLQTSGSGFQSFIVNANNIPVTQGLVSHSSLTIPNGIYTLRLSYLDTLGNPFASATETHLTMGNVLAPPVVTTQAVSPNCSDIAALNTAITSDTTGLTLAYFSDAQLTTSASRIAGPGTWYVKATNINGLTASASIVVNAQPVRPQAPYASSVAICSGSTASLTAFATGTAIWYTASVGGTLLHTGNSFTTPVLTDSTTYFIADSTCISSATRNPVTVLIHALPVVGARSSISTVCAGTTTSLTGSGATSYVWTGGAQDRVLFAPVATNTYTVTGTDGNNCTNTASVTVTVNELPTVTGNASATTVCAGTSISLNGAGATSYAWTDAVTDGSSFTPNASHTYSVTGTDGNNCSSTSTVTVQVNALPLVEASASATAVCGGASTSVIGHGAATYIWTGGVQDRTLFTPSATETYTVTGTDGNNCSNTAWVTITFNELPTVIAHATATTVCEGTSVTLTGEGATNYTWNNGVTNGVSFAANASHTYSVTGSNGNCSSTDTVTVNVNALPTVTANASATAVCAGSSISLTGGGATSYAWTDGVTDGSSFTPNASHTYSVTGTDGNNCSATSTVNITVNQTPVATTTVYSNTIISADQDSASYQWLNCNNNNAPINHETRQFFAAPASGNYSVIVSLNGCADTSSCVNITVAGIENIANDNSTKVYPNPSNGTFTIESAKGGMYSIIDPLGNTIRTVRINADSNYTMTIDAINTGSYFIVGIGKNEVTRQKLIILR